MRRSADFLVQAHAMFPDGGAAEGRPSWAMFVEGPLKGAETAFAIDFEAHRQPIEGVGGIRYVMLPPTVFFGPLVIHALLVEDEILIVSVIEDEGYWELIDTDPVT